MAGSHGENDNNCRKCPRKDTDEMVQCDACDQWYHFQCAGVDHNVADVSWCCENCKSASSTTTASFLTNASTPTCRSAENGNHQQSSRGIKTINQPDKLVFQSTTTEPAESAHATGNIGGNVNPNPIATAMAQPTSLQTSAPFSSLYTAPIMSYQPLVSWQNINNPIRSTYTQPNFPTYCSNPSLSYPQTQIQTSLALTNNEFKNFTLQRELELKKLEEEMQFKKQYLDAKYKILNETSMPNSQGFTLNAEPPLSAITNAGPTPSQLAARQSFPKQLPSFNGDPDEWPLFVSSFENSTELAGYTNAENLVRLQAALKGKAREMVKNKLLLPQMVPEIMRTLRMCFGRPEYILERAISKAKCFPPIKDRLEMLVEFAVCVQNICATMEGCQLHSHLNNPLLVKELVDKLPNNHKLSWAMCLKDDRVPVVKSFSDWLYSLAEAASSVTPLFGKSSASINTHTREDKIEVKVNHAVDDACIVCHNGNHKVAHCNVFKNMSLNHKWECVKTNYLCRQCLSKHKRKCNSNRECGIDGCKFKHNPLLHKRANNTQNPETNAADTNQQNSTVNAHSNRYDDMQPLFRIIPVNIHGPSKTKRVFAFLDEGSAVTLIEKRIFDEMGFTGENDPLCLKWTGDTTRMESDSVKKDIIISNVTSNKQFKLNAVHTVKNLGLSAQTIDVAEISKQYPYLAKLPIESYCNVTPTILIGSDNWTLAVPLKVREGLRHQPIASKTRLGWALQGCNSKGAREFRMNVHICDCQQRYSELHDMVKDFFCVEASKSTQLFSHDDKQALAILENTSKKLNGRYEVGLLWREQDICLPDNYNLALNRLKCLENKFNRNPSLRATIQSQIDNLLLKGYAIKLGPNDLKVHHDRTWYLPIFVVSNPNKPEKVRLVWDAAAKFNGQSLNDFLMTGPDWLNSLFEILLKFRIGEIAICADISEMFHRICIREEDMHAQRFLWNDTGNKHLPPSTFVMRALTFGVNCAPCIAHYIRDKNAELFKDIYPRAVLSIQKNHYVDDFIDSVSNEDQAIDLAMQVKEIHESAGFKMHNWMSNSKDVLNQLHVNTSPEQTIKDWGSTTKVLGLYWDPNNDEFRFICRFARLRRDVLNESLTPTKREMLQVLMSIYDPLGFASCYTIGLKILLQDIWRSGIAWDEKLSGALEKEWYRWKITIEKITSIRIPRCYSPAMVSADEIQLHTFVDASEGAYAAVCYLRIKKANTTSVALVAAKNKIAPLKPLSVPRLELQAAILGTRLAKNILHVHSIKTDSQFWWSDSKTTLRWLNIDPKKFHQFVMHRVGEILENTNVSQWRWVPSKQNPADLATKVYSQSNAQLWFSGPPFLYTDPSEWPNCSDLGSIDKTEMKRWALVIKNIAYTKLNIEYFSKWRRLYRAVATFMLYCYRLKELTKCKSIRKYVEVNCEMIEMAQTFLIKYAQTSEYSSEIQSLAHGNKIQKESKLISLNVYLDKDGVIRARGRLDYLNNHGDVIVLPTNHHVTFLMVRHYHELLLHQCHETAINKIKSHYHIPKLRVLFRKVRRMCQWCKNNYAVPQTPQMAPLPAARLAAFERPFTYVGVDYFGPINVAVGRRQEKRWGVIFTCLSVRAIHIEVAHSLDTSSCIMTIRNFISRRGTPKEIYSDNGTNFKAAEKVLCDHLKNVDTSKIRTSFERVKWKFNPPGAPHMGGAWERLVKSVKTILYSICPSMKFSDESLKNALCETEFIINSRPLTFVSIECSDDEAITPNHLLIDSSDGYKLVTNEDINLQQRWCKTQQFADQFWRRWLTDYTPIISRRTKWFAKTPPIKIDDVVIIVDPNLPRNTWPKGIVIDVVRAKDGQVRRATVKTKNGVFQRPVSKLAVLDVSGTCESKLDPPTSFTEEGIVAAK